MNPMDVTTPARRLRDRLDAVEADLRGRLDTGGDSSVSYVGVTTTDTAYPTTAGVMYAVKLQEVGGPEVEGGSATFADRGKVYALNLGGSVPPASTKVLVTRAGRRWVFRYDA